MSDDLLPINATVQERALSGATSRISDIPVPIRDTWNPDTCPPRLLAWLAYAFSVDQWDNAWTEAQKRDFIRRSVSIHRYKGTIGAVHEALSALNFDAQMQEWFGQSPQGEPFTFRLLLTADQIGVPQSSYATLFEVLNRTKNLRSHMSELQLTVLSQDNTTAAMSVGVGSEITVENFGPPLTVLNDTSFCI